MNKPNVKGKNPFGNHGNPPEPALETLLHAMVGSGHDVIFGDAPASYVWNYIGNKEILVPLTEDAGPAFVSENSPELELPHPQLMHWELRQVWIVEGRLHRGESNVITRRRFYIDQTAQIILLGEAFDRREILRKCYIRPADAPDRSVIPGNWYKIPESDGSDRRT